MKKSVISLISYDAHLLPASIETYYPYVDEIILGLDEDRISWSGNKFSFDEDKLWEELQKLDIYDKISVIKHNFHPSGVAIENDNYERNYLKSQCSYDWIFSFDADEQLVNGRDFFINFCPLVERYYNKVDLVFTWFHPFKHLTKDAQGKDVKETLVVANNDGTFTRTDQQGFATSKDSTFTYCRWTDKKVKVLSPLAVLHYSFCRTPKEFDTKLSNYGHSNTRGQDPFFQNWNMVNEHNWEQLRNFKTSGMGNNQWERLVKVPTDQLMPIAAQQAQMIL